MEPVQDLNLNRRYTSGFEPEVPVTLLMHGLTCQSQTQFNKWHCTLLHTSIPMVP